jgi:hypothetical protein
MVPATRERKAVIGYYGPTGWVIVESSANLPPTEAIGLAEDGTRDRVFAKRGGTWIELAIDSGGTDISQTIAGTSAEPSDAVRIVPIGSCDSATTQVLAELGDPGALAAFDVADSFRAIPVSSELSAVHPGSRIIESGCVADGEGTLHRVVAFEPPRPSNCDQLGGGVCNVPPVVIAVDIAGSEPIDLLGSPEAIGFARSVGGQPPMLLGESFSLEGQAVGKFLLGEENGEPTLELVDTDDTVFAPNSAHGGDFDGDDRLDVTALAAVGSVGDGSARFRLLQTLGAEHRAQPLIGVSPTNRGASVILRAADFDGDGFDVVAGALSFSIAHFGARAGAP